MTNEIVLLSIKDGVVHVTLNRPDVHNAFDDEVIARLDGIWGDLAKRGDVRAVVLRGAGKNFCPGGDLAWMRRAADYTKKQNYADAKALSAMLKKLDTLPQVTIACVQGAAFGGGTGLAACCDVVIAAPDALFALSEVRLGLIPATIGPYVINAIGARQARRYFQTGERFGAEKAREIGLVHELSADIEKTLSDILSYLSSNGPQAMRAAKSLCRALADGNPDTARLIADIRAGEEAKEGLSAFLEKRKAKWVK